MRALIIGGGTGGHVFPAIAVAKELEKQLKNPEILFVGSEYGLEKTAVPKAGFKIQFIRAKGLRGVGFKKTMSALYALLLSFKDAYAILREFKPDVVIGMGGYSSGAALLVASMMNIPTMIHEQNSAPGMTNRILGKFVTAVAVSHENSFKYFPPKKTHLTGNPVREEILQGDRQKAYELFSLKPGRFTVFVFGGSQGAKSVNLAVADALPILKEHEDRVQFLHQTGTALFETVQEAYRARRFHASVFPFISEMAHAYAVADLVVSRAGAIAIAEIALCGKASILIPYPFAASNHQFYNAETLRQAGAAELVLDQDLNGQGLAELIKRFYLNQDSLKIMEKNSLALGMPYSRQKLFELAMSVANVSR
jgi:UDP-N-acetylglucosamine--N-acetylmuramyl-(pentapeptide) pyrophosphoryl-undecaprenol N-acetylglucosamine transferase